MQQSSVTALIVAAGSGSRMGGDTPKQFRQIAGKAVLAHAVDHLASHPGVGAVRVVVGPGQEHLAEAALAGRDVGALIEGGAERADSVRAGLAQIGSEFVLVHDAARPFCPPDVIDRLLDGLTQADAAVPVLPVADTLAMASEEFRPISRAGLVRVQTPQAARRADLIAAYEGWSGPGATDESTVLAAAGRTIAAIEGDVMLEKLTHAGDWARAALLAQARLVVRTGFGFDVHAFGGEGPVILGGLPIPSEKGLAGHSDADVLLHALTDALLGAAGLGDIGQHFPPTDARWQGAASDRFLRHAAELIAQAGGIIDHVDCTIICEQPRIGPYREPMRQRIAEIIGLSPDCVSAKATTTERLGFTGRGEGIAAQAVATVRMPAAPLVGPNRQA